MIEIADKTVKILAIVGISALGLAGGFLYWKYVGCASGTCPITSNPYISSGYGALMGYLVSGVLLK